jgi:hypothetical protein
MVSAMANTAVTSATGQEKLKSSSRMKPERYHAPRVPPNMPNNAATSPSKSILKDKGQQQLPPRGTVGLENDSLVAAGGKAGGQRP